MSRLGGGVTYKIEVGFLHWTLDLTLAANNPYDYNSYSLSRQITHSLQFTTQATSFLGLLYHGRTLDRRQV
jgi:hypothetical protein